LGRGIAGIQGPQYAGSGCFHTRRVMYGLSLDDLGDDGSLSSIATSKYNQQRHKKTNLLACKILMFSLIILTFLLFHRSTIHMSNHSRFSL